MKAHSKTTKPTRTILCRKCVRDRTNRWRESNQDKIRQFYASIPGRSQLLYHSAKSRAADRGLPFNLDQKWIEAMFVRQDGRCAYTELPFDLERTGEGGRNPYAPSLDRSDPTQGYTRENTRLVLWVINDMKRDLNYPEFARLCSLVTGIRAVPPLQ